MVSDGIYDALISAGSDPNIQLESLRGYQFRGCFRDRRGGLFPRLFVGKPGGDPRACLVFSALGALWLSTPLWFPVQGVQISVWFLIELHIWGRCLSVVEIPQRAAGAVRFPFKDLS